MYTLINMQFITRTWFPTLDERKIGAIAECFAGLLGLLRVQYPQQSSTQSGFFGALQGHFPQKFRVASPHRSLEALDQQHPSHCSSNPFLALLADLCVDGSFETSHGEALRFLLREMKGKKCLQGRISGRVFHRLVVFPLMPSLLQIFRSGMSNVDLVMEQGKPN